MRFVLTLLLAVVVLFFLTNSYGSAQTIANLTGVPARFWGGLYIVILSLARLRWQVRLPKSVVIASAVIGILSLLLGLGVGIWQYFTPDNYVYNLLKLQPFTLAFLGNFLLVVSIISLPSAFLKKYEKYLLFGMAVWFLIFSLWVKLLPFDKYVSYSTEDGFVEYLQFFTVFVTALLLCIESFLSFRASQIKRGLLVLLFGSVFFFVAMEEISWGQRIIGFQTPAELAQVNVQNETTLHNIGAFNQLQLVGYIVICLIGIAGGLLHQLRPRWWNTWIPVSVAWLLFIPAIYYPVYIFNGNLHSYSEVMEMIFYGGVCLWAVSNLRLFRSPAISN